jgi:predicted  nucleic acid-binding Zn-ribbon protein
VTEKEGHAATKLALDTTKDQLDEANARASSMAEQLAQMETERAYARADAEKWKTRYEELKEDIDAYTAAECKLHARAATKIEGDGMLASRALDSQGLELVCKESVFQ